MPRVSRVRWSMIPALDMTVTLAAPRAKLEELGKASAAAWDQLKRGTNAAWEELEQDVKEAAKEFRLSGS